MTQPSKATSVTTYILITITLVILAVLIWRIADVFVVAFGGIIVATVLHAMAKVLSRSSGLSSRWSLVIVIFILIVVGLLVVWLFGNQAASQMAELQKQLPSAAQKFEAWLTKSAVGRFLVDSFRAAMEDNSNNLSKLGVAAGAVVSGMTDLILIFFLGIYFAADPQLYLEGALRVVPPAHRKRVRRVLIDAGQALQKWLLGQVIVMTSIGLLAGTSLAMVGVPLAFSLGILAGILEFIPVVGPILFSIPGILLAFAKGPEMAVWVLIIYIVVQQLESNIIVPLIQRWAVELAPAMGLLAVVAFGLLFGVMGIVFATPITVVVMVMVRHLYIEDTLENNHSNGGRAGC